MKRSLPLLGALLGLATIVTFGVLRGGREPSPRTPVGRTIPPSVAGRTAGPTSELVAPTDDAARVAPASAATPAASGGAGRSEADTDPADLAWVSGVISPPPDCVDERVVVVALLEELSLNAAREEERAGGATAKAIFARRAAAADVAGSLAFRIPFPKDAREGWLLAWGEFQYTPRAIRVVPGQEASVLLRSNCGALLRGTLVAANGSALDLAAWSDAQRAEAAVRLTVSTQAQPDRWFVDDAIDVRGAIDDAGRFTFGALPRGTPLELEARTPQFALARQEIPALEAGEVREVLVPLSRGGTVRGKVVDESAEPLAGATVRARTLGRYFGFDAREVRTTTSDDAGRYELSGVAPGTVTVQASREGWLETESERLALLDEGTIEGVDIVLGRGAALSGRVVSADGKGARARIDVAFDLSEIGGLSAFNMRRGASGSTVTDAEGNFTVTGLGRGPFTVRAYAPDPASPEAAEFFASFERASGADPEAHADGMERMARLLRGSARRRDLWSARIDGIVPDSEDLRLVLRPPAGVAGRVVDAAGEPLRAFTIHALRFGDGVLGSIGEEPLRERFDDENGAFRMQGLESGSWKIWAHAEGFALSEPVQVTVPQAEAQPLVFALVPAASVSGVVRNPLGLAAAEARVSIEQAYSALGPFVNNSPRETATTTRFDGTFLLEGITPGDVSLVARANGFAASSPLALTLAPGEQRTDVVFVLETGGVLVGTVFGPGGVAESGRMISISQMKSMQNETTTSDDEGRFRFEALDPGSWQVVAILSDLSVSDFEPASGEGDGPEQALGALTSSLRMKIAEIENGKTTEIVLGTPPGRRVALSGRVTRAGEPYAPATVNFITEGEDLLGTMKIVTVKSDGNYAVELDRPGRYVATVQRLLGGSGQQNSIEYFIEVPDEENWRADFAVPGGLVRGRVLQPDGEPAVQARVTLVAAGARASNSFMGGAYHESQTDGRGEYAIEGLRAGRYVVAVGGMPLGGLFADSASFGREVREIRLGDDERLDDFDFRLRRPGTVDVRVLDAGGQPVREAAVFVRDEDGVLVDALSWVQTDSGGRAAYAGLLPGRYAVTARAENAASASERFVEVVAGESTAVEVVVEQATRLSVTLLDEADEPLPASYSILDEHDREVQNMWSLAELQRLVARDGFSILEPTFGPLAPGRYRVSATTADGRGVTKPVKLTGQSERRLVLRLRE